MGYRAVTDIFINEDVIARGQVVTEAQLATATLSGADNLALMVANGSVADDITFFTAFPALAASAAADAVEAAEVNVDKTTEPDADDDGSAADATDTSNDV